MPHKDPVLQTGYGEPWFNVPGSLDVVTVSKQHDTMPLHTTSRSRRNTQCKELKVTVWASLQETLAKPSQSFQDSGEFLLKDWLSYALISLCGTLG
jgi:hypothetical protein